MNSEQEYYENKEAWAQERFFENQQEIDRLQSIIKMIPEGIQSLCDIGAGNGAFLSVLEKRREEIATRGVERSRAAICSKLCTSQIVEADIKNIPFDDQKFDLVTCMEVIEHLPIDTYEKGLRELERIAKQYILLSVPYNESRALVSCPYCGAGFNACYHVRSFNEESMKSLFAEQFSIENMIYIGPQPALKPFGTWIYHILKRKVEMPVGSICPQCGYRETNKVVVTNNHSKEISLLQKFKNKVVGLLSVNSYRWIGVLYKRK